MNEDKIGRISTLTILPRNLKKDSGAESALLPQAFDGYRPLPLERVFPAP